MIRQLWQSVGYLDKLYQKRFIQSGDILQNLHCNPSNIVETYEFLRFSFTGVPHISLIRQLWQSVGYLNKLYQKKYIQSRDILRNLCCNPFNMVENYDFVRFSFTGLPNISLIRQLWQSIRYPNELYLDKYIQRGKILRVSAIHWI